MRTSTSSEISSLAKEDRVKSMLAALTERFGQGTFQIIDDWEADLCAIGIALPHDPNKVVYISTYGLPEGRYSCHVDIWPPAGSDSRSKSLAKLEGIDFTHLAAAVGEYLGLA